MEYVMPITGWVVIITTIGITALFLFAVSRRK